MTTPHRVTIDSIEPRAWRVRLRDHVTGESHEVELRGDGPWQLSINGKPEVAAAPPPDAAITLRLDNQGGRKTVRVAAAGRGAIAWSQAQRSLLGESWQTDDKGAPVLEIPDSPTLVVDLQKALPEVTLDLSRYEGPSKSAAVKTGARIKAEEPASADAITLRLESTAEGVRVSASGRGAIAWTEREGSLLGAKWFRDAKGRPLVLLDDRPGLVGELEKLHPTVTLDLAKYTPAAKAAPSTPAAEKTARSRKPAPEPEPAARPRADASATKALGRKLRALIMTSARVGRYYYHSPDVEIGENEIVITYAGEKPEAGALKLHVRARGTKTPQGNEEIDIRGAVLGGEEGTEVIHQFDWQVATVGDLLNIKETVFARWFKVPVPPERKLTPVMQQALAALRAEEEAEPDKLHSWAGVHDSTKDALIARGLAQVLENKHGGFPHYRTTPAGQAYLAPELAKPEPAPQTTPARARKKASPPPGPGPGGLEWTALEDGGLAARWNDGAFKLLHAGGDRYALFYEHDSGGYETLSCGLLDDLKQVASERVAGTRAAVPLDVQLAQVACATPPKSGPVTNEAITLHLRRSESARAVVVIRATGDRAHEWAFRHRKALGSEWSPGEDGQPEAHKHDSPTLVADLRKEFPGVTIDTSAYKKLGKEGGDRPKKAESPEPPPAPEPAPAPAPAPAAEPPVEDAQAAGDRELMADFRKELASLFDEEDD